jgi:MFS family permease
VLPLVIVLAARRHIPESERWASGGQPESAGSTGRSAAVSTGRSATGSTGRSAAVARQLLSAGVRRNFLGALAVSIAITGGWWAVSSYLPSYVGGLVHNPQQVAFYTGWAGALYNAGEIAGCILLGFLAEWWGRKPSVLVYFAGCVVIVPIVYLAVHDPAVATWLQLIAGFLTGGVYSWYTVHTPELFATSYRATAISVVFSGSRYLAMIGAVLTGTLSSAVGGFGHAAALFTPLYLLGMLAVLALPETRGKPLPA